MVTTVPLCRRCTIRDTLHASGFHLVNKKASGPGWTNSNYYDGYRCEADVIIFATGFEVANPPIAERIVGSTGITLKEQWRGSPEVYLGTTAENCPNCFLTFGPNLYSFTSAFVIIEAQLKYILNGLEECRSKNIESFTVDRKQSTPYNAKMQSSLQNTVWNSGGCVSYFIDENGRNSTNWPWTTYYLRLLLGKFKLNDYILERRGISK